MRKGTLLLIVGVGAPALVLAAGWMLAARREAEGRQREAMALLTRSAEVIRRVVDGSLEELRLREDARSFDTYNHVYKPPDVVALGDALALSPLARDPEDPRVVGYFQIDPGGVLKTPYEPESRTRRHPRARDVTERVGNVAFTELRAQAHSAGAPEPAAPETQSIAQLNQLQNRVYEELQQAATEPDKAAELFVGPKKIPTTSRNDVDWGLGTRGYSKKRTVDAPPTAPVKQARSATPSTQNKATDENAAVVDYTPFVFDGFGDELVLYRLVSSGGSRSVQGVLLDRVQVLERWLPSVVERQTVAAGRPLVVKPDQVADCVLRTGASDVLEGPELCFPPEALAAVAGIPPTEIGLWVILLVVVAAAAVVTDLAARRADQLARQRGAFISAVSHELRTPLTTLRMHAELLRDGLVSDDKRRKFHDDMVQESVRLSHLVENVLEATRLEEGRRPLRASRGNVGAAVRAIAAAQAPFLQTKGCTIEVLADDVEATFDRQALEQVVVNLLDNAVKYGGGGDRTITVEVRDDVGCAVLRVLDRGPGIPSPEHERVFARFHRVQRPGEEHVVGTGLGLALVRELAQAHGGSARASDRAGGGCCIEVRLPREVPPAAV
ncbi:MAG: HAMP domain-containing histidine kinase [Deltaproteobacteria bacterium]|nr:HAMP domain-containing histidine kinase [Deltaproteobacteria bacterium]